MVNLQTSCSHRLQVPSPYDLTWLSDRLGSDVLIMLGIGPCPKNEHAARQSMRYKVQMIDSDDLES